MQINFDHKKNREKYKEEQKGTHMKVKRKEIEEGESVVKYVLQKNVWYQ